MGPWAAMPPKAKADFIKLVTNEADYKRELDNDAPIVVDVYSKCWGPCEMLEDKFTLLYFELAEGSGLKFIRAECDKITSLAEYKDQSQPTFLFYKDKKLEEKIDGPKISAIANVVKRMCGVGGAAAAPAATERESHAQVRLY